MTLFKLKYPKLLASSIDPYKLSTTIKGVMTAIVPLILMLAPSFGWTVSADDFKNFTDGIDGLIKAVEAAVVVLTGTWASFQIVWGLLRKVLVGLKVIKV